VQCACNPLPTEFILPFFKGIENKSLIFEFKTRLLIGLYLRIICRIFTQAFSAVASWLVRSCPDRAVRVRALAGDIVLCSWARHLTLTVPLSTQVYKWVPANST